MSKLKKPFFLLKLIETGAFSWLDLSEVTQSDHLQTGSHASSHISFAHHLAHHCRTADCREWEATNTVINNKCSLLTR